MPLIEPGKRAPKFTLVDQHGEKHTLAKYRGRVVVLYFYPKDDTETCTKQACQFRDHHPDFSKIGATVLGISPDDVDSHDRFASKHALRFPLLADAARDADGKPRVCDAYGVWAEKSMYGRRYMGALRTTYVIDAEGIVARRWDNVKVKGHVPEVLATTKLLSGVAPSDVKPGRQRTSAAKAKGMVRSRGESSRKPAAKSAKGRTGPARRVGATKKPAARAGTGKRR